MTPVDPGVLLIGPKNCASAIGAPWRWARDHARAWGVPVLRVDGKNFIDAAVFVAAMRAHAAKPEPSEVAAPDDADQLANMRAAIGMQRRAS